MATATVIIASAFDRDKVARWAANVKNGTIVTFKETKRYLPQNARFWAMLGEISSQANYHGIKLSPEDWKLLFLDALKREVRMVPNLDNNGFVSLGRSSSALSKEEMTDLIEIVFEWAARHEIVLTKGE